MGLFRTKQKPYQAWLDSIQQDVPEFTPDAWSLFQKPAHLMFIYDEMKQGHWRHWLIKNNLDERLDRSSFHCQGFTADGYHLWKMKKGNHSQAIPLPSMKNGSNFGKQDGWNPGHLRIRGELYHVRTDVILELDKCKMNELQFIRKQVNVIVPYHIESSSGWKSLTKVMAHRAFMYVGIPEYWNDLLDGGALFSPVQSYDPIPSGPIKNEYYDFTPKEYKGR